MVCVAQKIRGIHDGPPPESGARGRCLQPGQRRGRLCHRLIFRGGSGWPRLQKGWFKTFGLEDFSVGVGGGRRSPQTDMAYADAPQHSAWRRFRRCCWNQRQREMRRTQQKMVVAAWCSTAVAPPTVVVGGEGGDQASDGGRAELGDGVDATGGAGEGAIDPSGLPPMVRCGWEGGDQSGIERWAKLGNGVAAPVVAGEGAINPAELPLML
jgi:hypothetical protein